MKRERKQKMVRFTMLNRKSKTEWALGVQLLFRRTEVPSEAGFLRTEKRVAPEDREPEFTGRPMLSRLSIRQKIDLGYRVYMHIHNNPDFAFITPSPQALLMAVEALDEANESANNGDRAREKGVLKQKEKLFDDVFHKLLKYIDWIARGSETVYRSAGIVPGKRK